MKLPRPCDSTRSIVDVIWFSQLDRNVPHFGVVLTLDSITDQHKAYIGACPPRADEVNSALWIAQSGAKLHSDMITRLFDWVKPINMFIPGLGGSNERDRREEEVGEVYQDGEGI